MRSRVLLVEDSLLMCEAISRILQVDCELLACVQDGCRAMHAALDLLPDVIVLDVSLPGMSGMSLIPLLRSALPTVAIVMLTNHPRGVYAEEAYRRGADGYVLKCDAHEALVPAIQRGRTGPSAALAGAPHIAAGSA